MLPFDYRPRTRIVFRDARSRCSASCVASTAFAATQWTGTFNPRPFDASAALALYESAY